VDAPSQDLVDQAAEPDPAADDPTVTDGAAPVDDAVVDASVLDAAKPDAAKALAPRTCLSTVVVTPSTGGSPTPEADRVTEPADTVEDVPKSTSWPTAAAGASEAWDPARSCSTGPTRWVAGRPLARAAAITPTPTALAVAPTTDRRRPEARPPGRDVGPGRAGSAVLRDVDRRPGVTRCHGREGTEVEAGTVVEGGTVVAEGAAVAKGVRQVASVCAAAGTGSRRMVAGRGRGMPGTCPARGGTGPPVSPMAIRAAIREAEGCGAGSACSRARNRCSASRSARQSGQLVT
jgi:hypothetical protein